tara:strand:+ start:217 stop:705 length:489 start_codon:yes stop_codon:yes gene_type:complete
MKSVKLVCLTKREAQRLLITPILVANTDNSKTKEINMKNLMIFTLASLMSISAFAGLSKQERQEFVDCSNAEFLAINYNLQPYFEMSQWQELKVLYEAEMSPLDNKKIQRRIKKSNAESKVGAEKLFAALRDGGIREEHLAPILLYTLLDKDRIKKVFYSCF